MKSTSSFSVIKSLLFSTFIMSCTVSSVFAQFAEGTLNGRVTDISTGDALPGVTVLIKELNRGAQTDRSGQFSFKVPPGSYTLVCRSVGYKLQDRKVQVRSRELLGVQFKMLSSSTNLGGVTVEATRIAKSERALLEIRRKSAVIQDAIGAEQIEKTASITTAQALQRVTGVSVRDGKYITVRGLTDRNLVVQLNGSRLSSANAERSAVPLDIIPAQLLENITVEKTVTPDKPGDATGAIIEIKTKSVPESRFVQFSGQTGYNSNIGPSGYYNSYSDARLGFFGQQVSRLNLSPEYNSLVRRYQARGFSVPLNTLKNGFQESVTLANLSEANFNQVVSIDRAAKSFSPYLTTDPERAQLNQIYNFTYGDRYQLSNGQLIGLIFGLNYYNRYQSNPSGVNNLYSAREVNPSTPNISLPNEFNLTPIFTYRENTGLRQLNYGALSTATYRLSPDAEFSFSYNGNFGADAQASLFSGEVNSTLIPTNPFLGTALIPRSKSYNLILHSTERSLHTFQIKGEQKIRFFHKDPWRLSWSASTSAARQNDPNYRNTRVLLDSTGRVPNPFNGTINRMGDVLDPFPSDYQYVFNVKLNRYYRKLTESNQNYKIDVVIPYKVKHQSQTLKMGGFFLSRKRAYNESTIERLDSGVLTANGSYLGYGQPLNNVTSLLGNLDAWNSRANVGINFNPSSEGGNPSILYIPVALPGSNSYRANQRIVALYAMTDFTLGDWRAVGGVRIENTDIKSKPDTTGTGFIKYPGTNRPIITQRDFDDVYSTNYLTYQWLPSGSIIFNGIKKTNLRVAYGRTITRPELNEVIQSSQNDPLQQAIVQGNKNLKNGTFASYDFRTDYFPRPEEIFSFSFFYKNVTDQVERVYLPRNPNLPTFGLINTTLSQIDKYGDASSTITFRNNPNIGKVYGLEFEVRKKLDQLFPFGKYINVGTNLLLSRSTTRLTDVEYYVASQLNRALARNRPLIDQPTYAFNFNLGFEQLKWGSQINLLYNKTGRRLIIVNVDGTPNIYEYPAATFDITYAQKLGKKWQLKAFAKNILNEPTQYLYGTPANRQSFGPLGRVYQNRAFAYGSELTVGVNYIFQK